MSSRPDQRKQLRARRRRLTRQQRAAAALSLARRLAAEHIFQNSQRIAAYLPVDAEMDPTPLIERAWSLRKKIYLPVLSPLPTDTLWFVRYEPHSRMVKNRYGIPEPLVQHRHRLPAQSLDLVLTPLVGFDNHGNRLGMGGGFYDRTFAFLNRRVQYQKPRLLGLAYENQRLPSLRREPWDVRLHGVVTETHYYRFEPQSRRD